MEPILSKLPRYLDFKFVLNESEAGKHKSITTNLKSGLKEIKNKKKYQDEEKTNKSKDYSQKEYKKLMS